MFENEKTTDAMTMIQLYIHIYSQQYETMFENDTISHISCLEMRQPSC